MRWVVLAIILLVGVSFVSATTWKLSGDIFYYENGKKKICKHIEDNGTLRLGETIVTKYYKVENCSNLPAGGVHLIIDCYKKDENTIEMTVKMWSDNYTPEYDAYYFDGVFKLDNKMGAPATLTPGEKIDFSYEKEERID